MTTEKANKIYNILVELGGAPESERDSFVHHHCKNNCDEWRFQGFLGFGGKYRSERNTVDCYKEDEAPQIQCLMQQINLKLLGV